MKFTIRQLLFMTAAVAIGLSIALSTRIRIAPGSIGIVDSDGFWIAKMSAPF